MSAPKSYPKGRFDRLHDRTVDHVQSADERQGPSSNPDFGTLLDPPYFRKPPENTAPYEFSYDTVRFFAANVAIEPRLFERLDDYQQNRDVHNVVTSQRAKLDNLVLLQTDFGLRVSGSMSTFFNKSLFGSCDYEDMIIVVGEISERLKLPTAVINSAKISKLDLAKNIAVDVPPAELIACMQTPTLMHRRDLTKSSVVFGHTTAEVAFYDKRKELLSHKYLNKGMTPWYRADWSLVAPQVIRAEVRLKAKALPKVRSKVKNEKQELVIGDIQEQHVFQRLESVFYKRRDSVRVSKALEAFAPRNVKELVNMLAAIAVSCLGGYEATWRRIASLPKSYFKHKQRSRISMRLKELATDPLCVLDNFAGAGAFGFAAAGGQ